ncbi:MAG: type IV pilus secretin PilQ [Elusimicrobia bacterium]|nr:type IV pilus secretin PilQ [Elusimicrobiota bacterium]
MQTVARRSLAAALALALACPEGLLVRSFAAEASATVEGLSVGYDTVTIKLSAPAQYNGILIAKPPRLVVELLDAEDQVGATEIAGKGRFLKRVRVGQYQRSPKMIARVVMDLNEMAGYRLTQSDHALVVTLVAESAAAQPPAPATPAAQAEVSPKAAAAAAPQAAAPRKPQHPKAPAAVAAAAPVAVEAAAVVPAAAAKPKVLVKDRAEKDSEGESEAKAAPEEEESVAHASGLAKRVRRSDIMSRLPRDLVTLDFDATDIRDVFKLLAAKARVNIIFGSDVAAVLPLTLHLSDVPFNEAVQTILSMSGLVTMQVGDSIVRVLTPAQMAKERSTATTLTKIIPLNYTKASEILPALTAVRSAEGRQGSATADLKTNSLILTESPDGMATEERLIAQLDVRPKQVLIEAKLIEVTLSNSLDYGIQWNYFSADQGKAFGKNGVSTIGAPLGVATGKSTPFDLNSVAGMDSTKIAGANSPLGVGGGTGVNLPASNVLGALTLGRITNNQILNMTLTAAASQGKIKVLSDPKIATLNNQPANINVTTQYPYVTSSIASTAGGAVTSQVTYVSVGIQLTVTPTINADGRITLLVNPTVSQPSATAPTATGGAPGIDSRQAQTTVLIRDGETIVIGGLISDRLEDRISKIPLLGDIPILGWLFRSKHKARTRTELLIFVTPKILAD